MQYTPNIRRGFTAPGKTMDDGRARFEVSVDDAIRISNEWPTTRERETGRFGEGIVITDQATDTRWRVRPAPCGAGCICAAEAWPADD